MFIHSFLFRWKPAATVQDKAAAADAIRAFQGTIPGLEQVIAGHNESTHGDGFTFGGIMHFTDQDAYRAYAIHPAHLELLSWLAPLIEAVEFDITV